VTECPYPEIRDSLPDLLHGRLGEVDKATLMAHVESCAGCRAELALLGEIRESAPLAPRIDVERIAAALPVRSVVVPESPRRPVVSRVSSPVWKFAAAIAIAMSGALLVQDSGVISDGTPATNQVAFVATGEGAELALVAGVRDLTDEQIESLLIELDAIETIPSAEPEQAILYREES